MKRRWIVLGALVPSVMALAQNEQRRTLSERCRNPQRHLAQIRRTLASRTGPIEASMFRFVSVQSAAVGAADKLLNDCTMWFESHSHICTVAVNESKGKQDSANCVEQRLHDSD